MTVQSLPIVAEGSGKQVGAIRLDGQVAAFDGDLAERIFRSCQRAGGWTAQQTFAALATGWSNGYVTIPAQP
jgi:hypothetical protein